MSPHLETNTVIIYECVLLFGTYISFWIYIFHNSKFSAKLSSKRLFNNQKKIAYPPPFFCFFFFSLAGHQQKKPHRVLLKTKAVAKILRVAE